MNNPVLDNFAEVFDGITVADEKAAKAALGIGDGNVRAMDVSKLAIFLTAQPSNSGWFTVNAQANIHKRDAARVLRQIADSWDQEWKSDERANQKLAREAKQREVQK